MDQVVDRDELRRETERQQRELALLAERIRGISAELDAARYELGESLKQNTDLSVELEAARSETAALRSSTSWLLTAPLRSVVRALRGR